MKRKTSPAQQKIGSHKLNESFGTVAVQASKILSSPKYFQGNDSSPGPLVLKVPDYKGHLKMIASKYSSDEINFSQPDSNRLVNITEEKDDANS